MVNNINKLLEIKGNTKNSAIKLKNTNGFNERIKKIIFKSEDDLYEKYTIQLLRKRIDRELNGLEGQYDVDFLKKIFYFNKNVEEYVNFRINEMNQRKED